MKVAGAAQDQEAGKLLHQGVARQNAGDLAGAERAYLAVLKKRPRDPDAMHLLGLVYAQRGDKTGGIAQIQKALAIRDDFPDAHLNLGTLAAQLADFVTAERHLRRAIQYRPTMASAHSALGVVLAEQGRAAEAIEAVRTAVRLDPHNISMHLQHMRTTRLLGDLPAQLAAAEAGLQIAPGHSVFEIAAAEARFGLNDLKSGWRGFRRRFESAENPIIPKAYPLPLWQGEPLNGRSILIWTEQGLGDEVMYANMFADVIAAAQRCVIQCSPRLAPLFRRSFPKAEIFDRDLSSEDLRGIDFQSPAGSLGEWLRTDFKDFPTHAGYLTADASLRDSLRAKYGTQNLIVGIAWRSKPEAHDSAHKSVNVLEWGPIFHIPGITFVNLQYGDVAAELDAVAKGFGVRVIQDAAVNSATDIDTYAAQVAAMDVVVSSSNTAAHFAGALGVPTLCMLPTSFGRGRRWYWFAQQGACPWYPSMRLLLQRRDRQWIDVIRDVGLALVDRVAARGVAVAPYLRAMAAAFANMPASSDRDASYRREDALALCRRLAQEPDSAAVAHFDIAGLHKAANNIPEALEACDQALAADPTLWQAHNMKGSLLGSVNRFKKAIEVYRQGLNLQPDAVALHNNLATALTKLGREAEALVHYQRALEVLPENDVVMRNNVELSYAAALSGVGDTDLAKTLLDGVLARAPDMIDAHYNRATIALSRGELADGWREFVWRLNRVDTIVPAQEKTNVQYNPQYAHFPRGRQWNGEPLAGKNVLIWTEQGVGDEILIGTMIPDAIVAAGHVTILCSERLVPLFRRSFPTATVDERKSPLPSCVTTGRIDFQMSESDLGLAFRPTFSAFPAKNAFLRPNATRRDNLRKKYEAVHPGNRIVGISWSSLKNPELGWLKGPAFGAFAPILKTPGITFVNLQYGDRSAELAWARDNLGIDIIDDKTVDSLADMDAFTAQVAAMDMVVSTSNTAVHVAGALGIPTWVLLPESRGRHWYWFRDRADSPWYPNTRLFRQTQSNDWVSVIDRCAAEFRSWRESQ